MRPAATPGNSGYVVPPPKAISKRWDAVSGIRRARKPRFSGIHGSKTVVRDPAGARRTTHGRSNAVIATIGTRGRHDRRDAARTKVDMATTATRIHPSSFRHAAPNAEAAARIGAVVVVARRRDHDEKQGRREREVGESRHRERRPFGIHAENRRGDEARPRSSPRRGRVGEGEQNEDEKRDADRVRRDVGNRLRETLPRRRSTRANRAGIPRARVRWTTTGSASVPPRDVPPSEAK
jgi:hypothetical protein